MMRLDELLRCLGPAGATHDQRAIAGVTMDSRKVVADGLFVAVPGTVVDGARFVPDAVAAGAKAIVVEAGARISVPDHVALIRVANARLALSQLAAAWSGRQPATIVAVTGTNGKTSVADFTRQVFSALGFQAASMGTIGVVRPDGSVYGSLTTPDPVALHEQLRALADDGITHLAFEASSHGLDQYRLDGVRLAAAAFTNLGRDHLDYHPTVEDYLAAKMRLFTELLQPGQPAVIDADNAYSGQVIAGATSHGCKVLTTGHQGQFLRLVSAAAQGFAQRLVVAHAGREHNIELPLPGTYQASNALVAAGLAIATGADPAQALGCLAQLKGVKGRLEIVAHHNGAIVVVDYAHKPEALEAALNALRPFASGRLINVFGCGGDRDRGKRPIMGRISAEHADITIVTDDNPRTEVASDVRREILAGAAGAIEIGDRAQAIAHGVQMLQPGDVLLVAGKGHETGQIVGKQVLPFSDHEAIAEAIAGVIAHGAAAQKN